MACIEKCHFISEYTGPSKNWLLLLRKRLVQQEVWITISKQKAEWHKLIAGVFKVEMCNMRCNHYRIKEGKVARWNFSGSIPPKFEHKLRRHYQRFGEITTTAVKKEKCFDQGYKDVQAVIATKWQHYLFYLQPYSSTMGTLLSKSITEAFSSCSPLHVREV